MSYVGHGSSGLWASEGILRSPEVASFAPQPAQPLVLTMTCSNGYFLSPFNNSLAESLVLADQRAPSPPSPPPASPSTTPPTSTTAPSSPSSNRETTHASETSSSPPRPTTPPPVPSPSSSTSTTSSATRAQDPMTHEACYPYDRRRRLAGARQGIAGEGSGPDVVLAEAGHTAMRPLARSEGPRGPGPAGTRSSSTTRGAIGLTASTRRPPSCSGTPTAGERPGRSPRSSGRAQTSISSKALWTSSPQQGSWSLSQPL